MSRFMRIFSGKFQYLRNCAGVKHLTNIMSVSRVALCMSKVKVALVSQSVSESVSE